MPRQQKGAACVHCRQMKLRCDAHECFPAPCSRCTKQKLRCSIDPSFRRTARRQRINAIERELQELKTTIDSSPVSDIQEYYDPSSSCLVIESPYATSSGTSNTLPTSHLQEHIRAFEPQRIDEVEVEPSIISELFDLYYTHYQNRLPILPSFTSFAKSYDSCPLLFWTVIAVASRNSQQHSHLYSNLMKPVQSLATDINAAAGQSLATIQALLILCWWSFPFRATINDPSWTYCGLAIHEALRIGLHRPLHLSDFVYQAEPDGEDLIVRQKTWVACFVTDQELSSRLGVPSTVKVDNSILSALASRPSWLPPILEQHLRIAHQSFRFCHTLGHHELTTTGSLPNPLSIIRMFDADLRALELHSGAEWTTPTEIAFLKAKLQLCSFACAASTSESMSASASGLALWKSDILAQAYLGAVRLIQIASNSPTEIPFWTSSVRTSVAYAVFFLIKLSASPQHHFVDQITARNSISQAWSLLHGHSDTQHDHLSRICAIVEYLSKKNETDGEHGSPMTVKSRMSANLQFDAIWRARERFSQEVRNSKPLDYTSAAEFERSWMFDMDFQMNSSYMEGDILGDWATA